MKFRGFLFFFCVFKLKLILPNIFVADVPPNIFYKIIKYLRAYKITINHKKNCLHSPKKARGERPHSHISGAVPSAPNQPRTQAGRKCAQSERIKRGYRCNMRCQCMYRVCRGPGHTRIQMSGRMHTHTRPKFDVLLGRSLGASIVQ